MISNSSKQAPSKTDVICLMGPTASGKTAMAIELVKQHPFEIINVDSAQIYRGMDIGTGKPEPHILAMAPHRLIDIRDPSESYSASEFRQDALREIADIADQGKTPLLVGGTMLYFKVLRDGLADMPNADEAVRAEIEQLAVQEGWQAVHDWLQRVDPESANRIHPNDPQRLQRALEVFLVSGKTMTSLHDEERQQKETDSGLNLHFFAIQPEDRAELHEQIRQRFLKMLADGLVPEVERLYQQDNLSLMLPSIKSVGYRQVWQHLAGEYSYDEMVEKSIIATRQLAKRQLTWLRSWGNLRSLNGPSIKSIESILNFVETVSI